MALSGKLTKKLVENLGAGRHGDANGLYLVVDPSGARRWIIHVMVKGQKNKKGGPLRTDFGLGGADIVTINQARERALEYRRMAKQGLNPHFNMRQYAQRWVETVAARLSARCGGVPSLSDARYPARRITDLLQITI